ncbi:hypothetical protein ACKWTF_004477 [Chironomus riparius]
MSKSEVSASELSYLKAEVWSLQNKLRDEKINTSNLSESFRTVANEKYELLDELTRHNLLIAELYDKLDHEREINNILMNEIEELQEQIDKNQTIMEQAVIQNVELKRGLIEANETIHQMGLVYLKLKEYSP